MFVVEARSRQYSKETSQVFKGYRNYYDSLDTGFQNAMHAIIAFVNFIFFIGVAFIGTTINGRGWDTMFLNMAMAVIVGTALNLIVSAL